MPYTPTTPTLLLCYNLAALLAENWEPTTPDGVTWGAFARYGDADDPSIELVGRQVEFFPGADYVWENHTRDRDRYTHHVYALVVERYAVAGDATRDWWAERVDFVHTQIVQALRFTRDGPPSFNANLMTAPGQHRVQVCDLEKLVGDNKLFFALVELNYLELVAPPSD